jgi:hypothetical protein
MKRVLFLGVLNLTMFAVAYAAEPNYSEVDVISVIPRSPEVKPIAMTLPAGGHPKQAVRNQNQIAANATAEKVLSPTNGEKLLQKAPKQ